MSFSDASIIATELDADRCSKFQALTPCSLVDYAAPVANPILGSVVIFKVDMDQITPNHYPPHFSLGPTTDAMDEADSSAEARMR